MAGFRTILAGTDFSEEARRAVEVAAELARRFDATLVLLHVYQLPALGPYMPAPAPLDEVERSARQAAEQLAAELTAAGTRVRADVQLGEPGVEVVASAVRERADLVVVGTHGRSGLRRLVLGSVAEHVVRRAPCPVLTVRAGAQVPAAAAPAA